MLKKPNKTVKSYNFENDILGWIKKQAGKRMINDSKFVNIMLREKMEEKKP